VLFERIDRLSRMWARTGGCAADAAARVLAGRRAQACIVRALHARARHAAHRRAVLAALANTDEATLAAPAAVDVFGQARAGACRPHGLLLCAGIGAGPRGQRAQAAPYVSQRPLGPQAQTEEPGTAACQRTAVLGAAARPGLHQLSGHRPARR
jgi:hypothetical protein